jgi:hypothetical protein
MLNLVWTARPGARYVVERASRLDGASWQAISQPLTAQGLAHSWSYPCDPQAAVSFYRIVTVE